MSLPAVTANVLSDSLLETLEETLELEFQAALAEIAPDLDQEAIAEIFSDIAAYIESEGGASSDLTSLLTAAQTAVSKPADFQQKVASLSLSSGLGGVRTELIRQFLAAGPFVNLSGLLPQQQSVIEAFSPAELAPAHIPDASAAAPCCCPLCSKSISTPESAAAFTTVTSTGQLVSNGTSQVANSLKWDRLNTKADGKTSTAVTFAFDNSFTFAGIETSRAKTLFASALQTWADYAPIDFFEIENPVSGDAVDIWAQSAIIDGPGTTLAFAYFPSIGDITFDTDEGWTESLFLETAVHELGHSLGLAHEDGKAAIMNSVLANRFAGVSQPFLLEDDINGIRSLYGAGIGSVQTLAGPFLKENAQLVLPAPNLVVNGSFEEVPLAAGEYGVYSRIKGWAVFSGAGLQVDKRTELLGAAAEGIAWATLDVYGQNSTIGQNIDTVTGQTYSLSVNYTGGGQPLGTTGIDVFWEGQRIDTLTGGGQGEWTTFDYEVQGSVRPVSSLIFRAVGPSDNIGGFIDNISVTAKVAAIAPDVTTALGTSTQQQQTDQGPGSDFTPDPSISSLMASPFTAVVDFV